MPRSSSRCPRRGALQMTGATRWQRRWRRHQLQRRRARIGRGANRGGRWHNDRGKWMLMTAPISRGLCHQRRTSACGRCMATPSI
eukprot:3012986-Ditylum_brightwellii.AAC.1